VRIAASLRTRDLRRTLIRRVFDDAPPGAINLGLGQPDLPTPAPVALAGIAAIAEGRTGYTSTAGDRELREAIAADYRPMVEDATGVVVTVGSQQGMFAACATLLDPGDELLYPDPGYPAYSVIPPLLGARGVPYPLCPDRELGVDPDDVERRLTRRTRAVILCTPSNPTGACIAPNDLCRLTALLRERGIPWLSDEIYADFTYDAPFVSPAKFAPDGGLVVSGLSKALSMTGWRVGWVVGPPDIVARIVAVHQYIVTCAPRLSQHAALAAFGPAGRAARRRYVERFRARRALMGAELRRIPGIRFTPPHGAFYFFVDVREHGSSLDLARRILERQRVITIPGEAFGDNGGGFLRISFAADEAQIVEGIHRIADELGRGPGDAQADEQTGRER
jgi:aspartate/methionine/tyrosine aminotransferase